MGNCRKLLIKLNMIDLSLSIAYFSGVVSFFAPCVLPLLPAYIGYVAGVSIVDLDQKKNDLYRKKIIYSSLLFVLGFSLVFVLLGIAFGGIGTVLREYDYIIQRIGGLVIFILGLEFAGILNLKSLAASKQIRLPENLGKLEFARSFLVGIIFAFSWTPCVGAVLGSILSLAAVRGTIVDGALLLGVYSLGISTPFLIVSVFLSSSIIYIKKASKYLILISKVGGILLAIVGFMLMTGTYKYLNSYLFELAFSLGYKIK